MAKKKSSQPHVELKVAEIRTEATQTQPEMIWHLPLVVTASGAGAALKGAELAAKGIEKAIEAKVPALKFEIRDSWLENESEHRVQIHIVNTKRNGIYVESFKIKREYSDPNEIDQNRTDQPTVRSGIRSIGQTFDTNRDPVLDYPLLVKPDDVGTLLELSLPKVDRKKMKSERAVATVQFAELSKEKSDTIEFEFRLRWHPR